MAEKSNYFVLRAKAVPEVLLKVVEAKRLLDSGKLESVQEANRCCWHKQKLILQI